MDHPDPTELSSTPPDSPTLQPTQAEPIPAVSASPAAGPPAASAPARRLPPIFWFLIALIVVLLAIGVGSIFYYLSVTQQEEAPTGVVSGWDALEEDEIEAGLAVWSLAGISPEQLYRQAMALNEIETAAAAAITSADLPDIQRLGWLTVLARRHAIAENTARAIQTYQLSSDFAMLDPILGDHLRAETLITAAQGLADLGEKKLANDLLGQTLLIAQNSPRLSAAARRQLLDKAAEVYESLGKSDAANAARAQAGSGPNQPPAAYSDPLAPLKGELLYPQEIIDIRTARIAAAQRVVDAWIGGGQVPRSAYQILEATLIDEDIVRSLFYERQLDDDTLSPEQRALVLWEQAQWLLLKHRVAEGLFGRVLVANWTAELPAIRQQLHDTYLELSRVLREIIETLPLEEQPGALFMLYRHLLLWSRIGLYPDADEAFLANAMNDALLSWANAGGIVPISEFDERGDVLIRLRAVQPSQG